MDAREYFLNEMRRLGEEAKAITRKAEDENRPMTDEESAKVADLVKEIGSYKSKVEEADQREALRKAIDDVVVPVDPGLKDLALKNEDVKTLGEAWVRSDAYRSLKARGIPSGDWRTETREFGTKLTDAGLSVVATTDAGGTLPLNPQVLPIVGRADQNPLVVANLFGQGTATQNLLVYLEETTTTPGVLSERYSDSDATITTTAEGTAKPAAYVDFTKRSKSLTKLAAFLPVSDEMLEDEPAIVSYINGRLALFIRQAEDSFLLSELLAAVTATAAAGDIGGSNKFDAIAAGIVDVQTQGGSDPDAVLMNPLDFWKMSISKSAGDGNYFGGTPYRGPQDNPWGIPVVVTNRVPTGTAIVGAFKFGATVWRKGGLSVAASNSHSDYFRKNLTAIRVEERIALTVFRPGAFSKVSL